MPIALQSGVPIVDLYREDNLESIHHGSIVVIDASGAVVHAVGSVDTPVFPRSSNKPMQGLAMVRSGLDSRDEDLALGCASHSGEAEHVRRALGILDRAGLTEDDLQCPPDWPRVQADRDAVVVAGGGERRAYFNCSGKHASMLAACVASGWPTATYLDPEHPLQVRIKEVMEEFSGEKVAATTIDGCGAPQMAISLTGLARCFSRFVQAEPGTDERRIADAMRAHPFFVAGTGREDTVFMTEIPGVLMKGGADGVHVFALDDGRAVALKIDDGAARARVPLLRAAFDYLGVKLTDEEGAQPDAVTGGGRVVGSIRVRPGVFPA